MALAPCCLPYRFSACAKKRPLYFLWAAPLLAARSNIFCSWLQETVTGTVSWDYSGMPFNLNGRINLYIACSGVCWPLVWVKEIYPRISGWIEQECLAHIRRCAYMGDCGFYAVEQLVSGAAVLRMTQRYEGVPATSAWQQLMDRYYRTKTCQDIPQHDAHKTDETAMGAPWPFHFPPGSFKAQLRCRYTVIFLLSPSPGPSAPSSKGEAALCCAAFLRAAAPAPAFA